MLYSVFIMFEYPQSGESRRDYCRSWRLGPIFKRRAFATVSNPITRNFSPFPTRHRALHGLWLCHCDTERKCI